MQIDMRRIKILTIVSSSLRSVFTGAKGTTRIKQYGNWLLFSIILVHFLITYHTLYARYIFFEMREPTDSATYMQVSWSIIYGSPFTISIQENLIGYFPYNFLGDQLMLTLSLFSPFLLFTSSGLIFLVIQPLIISLGSVFLYKFACSKLKNSWLPLLIITCYLFNPATFLSFQYFGFRVETLFIPCIFAMFFFIEKNNYLSASISLLLVLLTKHNAIAISFMLGLYFFVFHRKQWRFGLFCLVATVVYYIVGIEVIMSHFQENQVAHFKHFAQFGSTPVEAVVNMIRSPDKIFSLISQQEMAHIGLILFPAGFLSLFSPVFWISSPQLVMNAVLPDYHSIFCGWHWALVVPFIFVGMISTIHWILNKSRNNQYVKYLIATLLIIGLFVHLTEFNKLVLEEEDKFYFKQNNTNTSKIIDLLSVIEADASVMVSGQLLWFFFDRDQVYTSRVKFHDDVDYVAILLPIGMPHYRNIDRYLIEEVQEEAQIGNSRFRKFDVIVRDRNLIILKHKGRG